MITLMITRMMITLMITSMMITLMITSMMFTLAGTKPTCCGTFLRAPPTSTEVLPATPLSPPLTWFHTISPDPTKPQDPTWPLAPPLTSPRLPEPSLRVRSQPLDPSPAPPMPTSPWWPLLLCRLCSAGPSVPHGLWWRPWLLGSQPDSSALWDSSLSLMSSLEMWNR